MTAITSHGGLVGLAGLPGVAAWPPGGHGPPVGLVLGAELAAQGRLLVAVGEGGHGGVVDRAALGGDQQHQVGVTGAEDPFQLVPGATGLGVGSLNPPPDRRSNTPPPSAPATTTASGVPASTQRRHRTANRPTAASISPPFPLASSALSSGLPVVAIAGVVAPPRHRQIQREQQHQQDQQVHGQPLPVELSCGQRSAAKTGPSMAGRRPEGSTPVAAAPQPPRQPSMTAATTAASLVQATTFLEGVDGASPA